MVDTLLVIVTLASLAFALVMGMIVWRLMRLEQKRSAARVDELRDEADAWEHEDVDTSRVRQDGVSHREPAPPLWTDLVIERTVRAPRVADDDRVAAAHLFRREEAPEGNGRRLVAGFALSATFLALTGAIMVSLSSRTVESAPAAAPPPLELLSLEHARAAGQLAIRGVVRNPVGREATPDLVAVVFLFDKDGRYLGTVKQAVTDPALTPGSNAAFEVSVSEQLPVGRYRVTFHAGRDPVPHLDRRQTAPPAPVAPVPATAPSRRTATLSAAAVR